MTPDIRRAALIIAAHETAAARALLTGRPADYDSHRAHVARLRGQLFTLRVLTAAERRRKDREGV